MQGSSWRWLSLATVAAVLSAGPAEAQVASDTARLAELTVSATRVPVPANAVTATVSAVTGDELRARGIAFVADALTELPSGTVVQGGGIGGVGAYFLRGGESDYVKVLLDGVPLNDAGGAYNLAHLTTANVERIEVVRGPVSVLYGSDAVSGLVQIFTRRGAGPTRIDAAFEGGTDATARWDLSASGGRTGLAWSGGISRFTTDGMYDFNNDYRNTALSGRLAARPDDRSDAAATVRYIDARSAFPTDFAGVPSDSNQFGTYRQLAVGLEAGRFLSDILEARTTVTLARTETGADDQPDHPGDTGFGYRSERTTLGNRIAADARVNLRPAGSLVVTAGAHYEREAEETDSETESDFGAGPSIETSRFDARRHTVGLYGQLVAEPAAGLALTLNARVDENSAFGALGTVRAGTAYRFAEGTRIRGSLGTAFKAPTFCEQFCAQPFIVGDSTLDPERATTWELGIEQPFAEGRITLGATWFDQRFGDRIEYRAAGPEEPNYVNLTAARARGLELAATVAPLAALRIAGSWTWLDTEITDGGGDPAFAEGEPLLRRPAYTLSLTAVYAAGAGPTLSLGVVRVGARDDTDFAAGGVRAELSAYVTVSAAASMDLIRGSGASPSLGVTLRGENLLDEEYQQIFGFPGRGRMVFAGVRAGL